MCLVTFSWQATSAEEKVKKHRITDRITWAYVDPTTACNMSCQWCYSSSNDGASKLRYMNRKQMEHTMQMLVDAGIQQVSFGGGEPLMYPGIAKWVSWLTKKGIIVHINSNGFFLSRELANELAGNGLEQVQINVESIEPEIHDQVRGRQGSHKRALEAIEYALRAGIIVASQIVVTKKNMDDVLPIIGFCRHLGVQRCRVWDMTPSGRGMECVEMIPHGYRQLLFRIAQKAHEWGAVQVQSYDPLFPLDPQLPIEVMHVPCPERSGMLLSVAADGSVLYCNTLRAELYNMNNVKTGVDLSELHHYRIEEFNRTMALSPACSTCAHRGFCRGGCPARMQWAGGGDYQCTMAAKGSTSEANRVDEPAICSAEATTAR